MKASAASNWIVVLAGLTIIGIAIAQVVASGRPDQYTIGALLALALGGSVGRAVDTAVKGYVDAQSKSEGPHDSAP